MNIFRNLQWIVEDLLTAIGIVLAETNYLFDGAEIRYLRSFLPNA
jgi:hypothetical protein